MIYVELLKSVGIHGQTLMFCAIIVLGKPGAAVAAEADDGSEMLAHSSNRQI